MSKSAHRRYPENLVSKTYRTSRPWFVRAVKFLQPVPTTPELLALLEHRCTYEQARNWRRGLCAAPQWAVDLIADRIIEQGRQAIAWAAQREHGPGHGGGPGALNLRRYRLQKALEREKGAS